MSEGLPRALITILKHVYDWSIYTQERPFKGGQISIRRAQQRGVIEAAEWFLIKCWRKARMVCWFAPV